VQENLKQYTVDVVIPMGAIPETWKKCVGGIINQTIKPQNVFIVCNNGVMPENVKLPEDVSHPINFHVIDLNKYNNANVARNYGVEISNSEFIAFLDSDDWWEVTHIESSLLELKRTESDFIYSGLNVWTKEAVRSVRAFDYRELRNMETYLIRKNAAQTSSYVLKRNAARAVLWNEKLKRHQDYDFLARFSQQFNIQYLNKQNVNRYSKPSTSKIPHLKDAFWLLTSWQGQVSTKDWMMHYSYLLKRAVIQLEFRNVVYGGYSGFAYLGKRLTSTIRK